MKYQVSGVRQRLAGQPFIVISDSVEGKAWAFIPYSDRQPGDHQKSYRDAQACCDGLNAFGTLVSPTRPVPSISETSSDFQSWPEDMGR